MKTVKPKNPPRPAATAPQPLRASGNVPLYFNTLRPTQNGRRFADNTFKCIFLNENTSISINIALKFGPEGRINNIPALVQIMPWRRLGDKPLSEPMMVNLLTHICVTRPQWVKCYKAGYWWNTYYLTLGWYEWSGFVIIYKRTPRAHHQWFTLLAQGFRRQGKSK